MPTPVAHSLAGAGLYLAKRGSTRRFDPFLFASTIVAACLADIDFGISFLTGINYHHYFTHSLGFTVLFTAGSYVSMIATKRERPASDAALVGLAYLSHVLLDMLSEDTATPYGVELLWPFSKEFFVSPVLVFDEIWRGTLAKLFGWHNWMAVAREAAILGPVVLAIRWWRRR